MRCPHCSACFDAELSTAIDFSAALPLDAHGEALGPQRRRRRPAKDPKKQERQARSLDKKRKMQVLVKRSDVASGRWPAAPLVDRLADAMGVKGRSGTQRPRDMVKRDILNAWSDDVGDSIELRAELVGADEAGM